MVGRMYVRAPVSSNMMTTTVTVMRIIPLRKQRYYQQLTKKSLLQRTSEWQQHRGMHKSQGLYMGRQVDIRQTCQKWGTRYRPQKGELVPFTKGHRPTDKVSSQVYRPCAQRLLR